MIILIKIGSQMQRRAGKFRQVETVNHLLMAMEFVSVASRVVTTIARINVKPSGMFVDLMIEK